jgi:hypothetical protein
MAVSPMRRASRRFEIRVEPADLADLRQLARAHHLPLSRYLVECGLARLQPGVDRFEELERRVGQLEQTVAQARRGY